MVFVPILCVRKGRHREVEEFTQVVGVNWRVAQTAGSCARVWPLCYTVPARTTFHILSLDPLSSSQVQ